MLWILAAGSLVSPKPIPAMYPAPISNSTPGPQADGRVANIKICNTPNLMRHDVTTSCACLQPTRMFRRNAVGKIRRPQTLSCLLLLHPGREPLARPRFVQLATAAAVVLAATAAVVVVVGHAAAATAVVAAPAEQEEDDENDPPRVVATAHETIVAIAVHKEYLQEVFFSGVAAHSMVFRRPHCVRGSGK